MKQDNADSGLYKDAFGLGAACNYALNEACIVAIVDLNGVVVDANANFCAVTKCNKATLLANAYTIFPTEYNSTIVVEDARNCIGEGRVWRGDIKNVAIDGTLFWFHITVVPVDDEGKAPSCVAICVDITSRKALEEEVISAYRDKVIVFDRITDSVISLDNEWRYTFLNNAALATHPNGASGTLGRVIWDVHPQLIGSEFWEKYHEALETKKVLEFESYYGPFATWFSVKVYPTNDGLTICYRDINAQKKAEATILQEKTLSESIINSLPGIFYLYDRSGKFLRWNKNFETITGYSAAEIEQMHPLDFFDTDEKLTLSREIAAVFETGKGEVEAHLLTKHRQRIPYYFNGYRAVFDGKEYLLGVGIDIAERTLAGLALKESEEKYRYLFDNSPALVIIWDVVSLKVLEVNNVALERYGYTREEFIGLSVQALRPKEDYAKIEDFATMMLNSKKDKERRFWRHIAKNGALMYMDITSHRIDYQHKTAILSLAKDITDQVLAEQQLTASYEDIRRLNTHLQTVREQERTSISREIHDELGQMLTVLKMDAFWLQKKIQAEDTAQLDKLGNMLALIDETIKTVRRISSDLRPGILDDLGLVAALEWQSAEFEKRTGIACSFHSTLADMLVPPDMAIGIFRIYQETLTNVMRHANASAVDTRLDAENRWLILSVSDNGVGFDMTEVGSRKTLGMMGMRERALMFGGELTIGSKLQLGTKVQLKIPLP